MNTRLSVLRHCKEFAKATAWVWDPIYRSFYGLCAHPPFPAPPVDNRRRVGSIRLSHYYASGYRCYAPLRDAINRYGSRPLAGLRILDFGAGAGRVLGYFQLEGPSMYAVDVDQSAVDFLREAFPQVHSSRNDYTPPLSYVDNSFDVIYSVSIWTHLPLAMQRAWLTELRRVARVGALVLITTAGLKALRHWQHSHPEWRDVTPALLESEGVVYREYQGIVDRAKDLPGVGQMPYGLAVHAPSFIYKCWASDFEVLGVAEGIVDYQDLVLLKRIG